MCRSQNCRIPGGWSMPCVSCIIKRFLLALFSVVLLAGLAWTQESKKKPKSPESKPASVATPAAVPGEAGTPSTAATEESSDEVKGPWHGLTWRLVGPFRGGRVLAVSGVVGDTRTYYFGGVAGGVWKSTDGGLTWRPMTDKTKDMSPSIGAIAVAPSDPNVIYAGTGEACIRGDIIAGNGVY